MRKKGVEPIHPNREQEPESCASTNFATFARSLRQNNRTSALYAPYESMASFFLSHASFLTPYGILCHQRLCARLSPATDILPFKASPYLARWAQYGLQIALSRPMGSIRALASAMCSGFAPARIRLRLSSMPNDSSASLADFAVLPPDERSQTIASGVPISSCAIRALRRAYPQFPRRARSVSSP